MIRNNNSRQELGRKRGLASAASWTPQEADADTLQFRALHDAKGKVIRHGITYTAKGEDHWSIRRALNGRINQKELVVNDVVIYRGNMGTAKKLLTGKTVDGIKANV